MSEQNVALLKEFAAAWNRHDLEALMGMMTDDCVFHTVAGDGLRGTTHVGQEAVAKAFEQAWLTCPDAQWTDFIAQVVGDFGFYSTTYSGTNAEGMRTEARMVDLIQFRDGKIAVKDAYRKNRPAFKSE